jgi:hypothetical protein
VIKINLLDTPERRAIQTVAEAFFNERENLSFSGRNPELGKMINCGVCGRRHRSSHTCVQNYTVEAKSSRPPKGRILRHRNAWGLQVLERATKIFNVEMSSFPNINDPEATLEQKKSNQEFIDKTGKSALSRSLNQKRAERAARRKTLHIISRKSKRINRTA